MKLCLIVAMSQNRVIGRGGQLPWRLPADLRRFKALTKGYPIIMGRRTHESIGRVLPGRTNVVLTKNVDYRQPGVSVCHTLDQALSQISGAHDKAFIIGGTQLYQSALARVDCMYLTLIHQQVQGDACFPEYDDEAFVEVGREDYDDPMPFSFVTLDRIKR